LARRLKPGDIISLMGELGSGKTTLVKGLAKGLGIPAREIRSPSFTLLHIHTGRLPLFHFDFYRLEDPQEMNRMGCDEFLYDEGVSVLEWADRMGPLLPESSLLIELIHQGKDKRIIRIRDLKGGSRELLRRVVKTISSKLSLR